MMPALLLLGIRGLEMSAKALLSYPAAYAVLSLSPPKAFILLHVQTVLPNWQWTRSTLSLSFLLYLVSVVGNGHYSRCFKKKEVNLGNWGLTKSLGELEGQAAAWGLPRPWKQLELAHPGSCHFCPHQEGRESWDTPRSAGLTNISHLVIRKRPPPLVLQLPINPHKTSYQILKHFCRKSQCLHDCACQEN